MILKRTAEACDDWLTRTQNTNIPELISFVNGLRTDYAAVKAALSRPASSARCGGQINRLKFIKRSMYGRANFDLLQLYALATRRPDSPKVRMNHFYVNKLILSRFKMISPRPLINNAI